MLNRAWSVNGKDGRLTRATVQRQELIPCVSLWGGLDRVTGTTVVGMDTFVYSPSWAGGQR